MATKKTPSKTTAAPKEESKQIVTKPSAALAAPVDFDVAGAGDHNFDRQDLAIPRLSILQSGSPQVKKGEGAYIKGAEEGDFFDSVEQAILAKGEDGILIIPVRYRRAHIEWIPKKQGGGFVADHGSDDSILLQCQKNEDNAMMLPNGHEIVTCAEYFVLASADDGENWKQAVVSLAKTQLKKAKKLNSQLSMLRVDAGNGMKVNPRMYYSAFHATTVPESNDKGSWMGWSIVRRGDTPALFGAEVYAEARAFWEAIGQGSVRVAAPQDDQSAANDDTF